MIEIPKTTCPLCQSAEMAARHRIHIPEIGDRGVAECPNCRYACVLPVPTLAELERFYSKEYFEGGSGSHGFDDYLTKNYVRRGEGWLVGRRLRREKPHGRALEVGCGSGDFLRGVQQASGWEAFGTDLSSHIIEYAGREPGLTLFCGELAAAAYPDAHFDAVFLRNVLEHVPDPVEMIVECRRILAPGGLLWLLVPNGYTELAPFAAAEQEGRVARDVQGHLNFFKPAPFRAWLRRCGFQVEQIYTLGLKRGLFELGYLPKGLKLSRRRKRKPAAAPVPDSPAGGAGEGTPTPPVEQPSSASPETVAGSAAPSAPASRKRRFKESIAYAYLRRFLKTSLKLPVWLPLGQELHAVVRLPKKSG